MLIHAFVSASRVNGPGLRAVVYVQGCSLHCRSCWNPKSHEFIGDERSCALTHKLAALGSIKWQSRRDVASDGAVCSPLRQHRYGELQRYGVGFTTLSAVCQ